MFSFSFESYTFVDSGRAQHYHIKAYPEGYIAENGTFIATGSAVQSVFVTYCMLSLVLTSI